MPTSPNSIQQYPTFLTKVKLCPTSSNNTQHHPTMPNIFDQSQTLPNIIQQYPTSPNNAQHGWPNDPNIYTQHCWDLLGKNVGIVWPGLNGTCNLTLFYRSVMQRHIAITFEFSRLPIGAALPKSLPNIFNSFCRITGEFNVI